MQIIFFSYFKFIHILRSYPQLFIFYFSIFYLLLVLFSTKCFLQKNNTNISKKFIFPSVFLLFSCILFLFLYFSSFFASFYFIHVSSILQLRYFSYVMSLFLVRSLMLFLCKNLLWKLWITLWITLNSVFSFTSYSQFKLV